MVRKLSKDILKGVRTPANMCLNLPSVNDKPLIIWPKDKSYIQILDYKIEGFEDFEAFMKYLKRVTEVEKENDRLKEEIRLLRNDKSRVIEYLETRIEECKIDRAYENRIALVGMRESIYQEVLDKVEGKK